MSLESTLGQLLKALKENKKATGTDEWTGKPEQGPLPVGGPQNDDDDVVGFVDVKMVSKGPADDMEGLMKEWVKGLVAKHSAPNEAPTSGEKAHPLDHVAKKKIDGDGTAAPAVNLEDASLEDLLAQLDNIT